MRSLFLIALVPLISSCSYFGAIQSPTREAISMPYSLGQLGIVEPVIYSLQRGVDLRVQCVDEGDVREISLRVDIEDGGVSEGYVDQETEVQQCTRNGLLRPDEPLGRFNTISEGTYITVFAEVTGENGQIERTTRKLYKGETSQFFDVTAELIDAP